MGKVKRFFDVTSKGLDKAVKFWKECCDASDAAARFRQQQQQEQQDAQIAQNCLILGESNYCLFAEIVAECVSNNAALCGLRVPRSIPQIYAPLKMRVYYDPQINCYCFRYHLDRDATGGMSNGKLVLRYSAVTELEIKETLDAKIENFAFERGCGPVGVLNVEPVSAKTVQAVFAPKGRGVV